MDASLDIADRTCHHWTFADIAALVQQKHRQGVSISLCLPALDEEETIGRVVSVLGELATGPDPLLDEIAVIDSGSSDRTRELAAEAGAKVYVASEHLQEHGDHYGKGVNLWKALYLLRGDIILYVDTDIRNIHPRFAYGLLGPLLADPELLFSKACYRQGDLGAVTECLARPLLRHFYPELAGLADPLSGEYAGRRSLLETLYFPTDFGVEIATLVDIYRKHGIGAIAQVDLDIRSHRARGKEALGLMSRDVLRGFLGEGITMPPMLDVEEYRQLRSPQ